MKNAATFDWAQCRFKHEPVFYAHMKGKSPAWYGDRTQTTVWKAGLPVEDPLLETVWEVSRGDVNKYVHPTQKPLDLLAIPIKNSNQRGDEIVDFFGGSGFTLMTCSRWTGHWKWTRSSAMLLRNDSWRALVLSQSCCIGLNP